jgi:hypothetical protein
MESPQGNLHYYTVPLPTTANKNLTGTPGGILLLTALTDLNGTCRVSPVKQVISIFYSSTVNMQGRLIWFRYRLHLYLHRISYIF